MTLFATAVFLLPTVVHSQQPPQEVSGEVLDSNDKGIPAVLVRVYRNNNQKIAETSTDGDGKYKLGFQKGSRIDLRYDHSDWNPATVEALSGARNHNLSKVLYPLGASLSPFQRAEVFSSLQSIYLIERSNKTPSEEIIKMYERSIKNLGLTEEKFEFAMRTPYGEWEPL
jgi:hypothetical protein